MYRIGDTPTAGGNQHITWNTPCGDPMPKQSSIWVPFNYVFDCGGPIAGRYVTIQRSDPSGYNYMRVAELYVVFEPNMGFGWDIWINGKRSIFIN